MVEGVVTGRNLLSLPSFKEVLYDEVENSVLEIKKQCQPYNLTELYLLK